MKRDATRVIWRTVVFAGAMLGTPACSKKQPQTTPQPSPPATQAEPAQPPAQTTEPAPEPPPADPATDCRARGCDDDGGGGIGRGFILS